MTNKSTQYYQKHLQKYFEKHYWTHEAIASFYNNPSDNSWKFYIPILEVEVLLTCDDNGRVNERKTYAY